MKKALQMLALLLAAVLTLTAAAAQENMLTQDEGLLETEPVAGKATRPDSAQTLQASFVLTYQFPQFKAVTAADERINAYYQALAEDLERSILMYEEDVEITSKVAHNSARYVSIVQTMSVEGGNGTLETLSADTFARDGVYAGQLLTLSQVLGLEETGELSTALSVAETLAYELIWELVEQAMKQPDSDYPEGLTLENLQGVFLPETDFYLDADGNIVFFIQAGELASDIAGVLRFPFAAAELLSALKK